jgi:hypothetical protein
MIEPGLIDRRRARARRGRSDGRCGNEAQTQDDVTQLSLRHSVPFVFSRDSALSVYTVFGLAERFDSILRKIGLFGMPTDCRMLKIAATGQD